MHKHKPPTNKEKTKKKQIPPMSRTHISLLVTFLVLFAGFTYWFFTPTMPVLPTPAVREAAAKHNVRVGMMTYPHEVTTQPFSKIVSSQYSFLTIDGAMHWDKTRPGETTYDFGPTDKIVNFGAANNLPVQIHHLLWTEDDSLPKWLKNGSYNKESLYQLIHDHVDTVIERYKGKVTEYTVVNEPFTRAKHMYNLDDWWGDHLGGGTDYIDQAFLWARQADPNAKLILNDFNNETATDTANIQYAYMKSAKERSIPIDGMGIQLHVDANNPPDAEAMVKNMDRFADLGYDVYITEFDVNSSKVTASDADKAALEARITYDMVRACVDAKSCVSFTVFGMTDKPLYDRWMRGDKTRSFMLSGKYEPKASYEAFHSAWLEP